MSEVADNLRARATECRKLAAKCRTTETHDLLLQVAQDLDEEADKENGGPQMPLPPVGV